MSCVRSGPFVLVRYHQPRLYDDVRVGLVRDNVTHCCLRHTLSGGRSICLRCLLPTEPERGRFLGRAHAVRLAPGALRKLAAVLDLPTQDTTVLGTTV
jgi:hypothetical protein